MAGHLRDAIVHLAILELASECAVSSLYSRFGFRNKLTGPNKSRSTVMFVDEPLNWWPRTSIRGKSFDSLFLSVSRRGGCWTRQHCNATCGAAACLKQRWWLNYQVLQHARTHVRLAWKFVWLSRFQRDNVRAIIELVYTLDTAITWLVVRSSLVCIIASSSSWFWAEDFMKSHFKHHLS